MQNRISRRSGSEILREKSGFDTFKKETQEPFPSDPIDSRRHMIVNVVKEVVE